MGSVVVGGLIKASVAGLFHMCILPLMAFERIPAFYETPICSSGSFSIYMWLIQMFGWDWFTKSAYLVLIAIL